MRLAQIEPEKLNEIDAVGAGVIEIISGISPMKNQAIDEDTALRTLGFDSLDLLELLMQCERRFAVSIPDHEVPRFRQVRDVIDAVRRKGRPQGGAHEL
jgi:acyl carrier protein